MKKFDTKKLVLLAILTAIVVVLQGLATILPVFPFTLTLVLIPIVIGAALLGVYAGAWLGLVFGFVVLAMQQATLFLMWNAPATIFVVLLKGSLAGLAAGFTYKLLEQRSRLVAVIAAAAICPLVNTGIFVLGSYVFFLPQIAELGGDNVANTIFLGFIGINFPIELAINLAVSPAIIRLIKYGKKTAD